MTHIQNSASLATTPTRTAALSIVEAGLRAIDTEAVVRSSVTLDGMTLQVKDTTFDLGQFERIRVIGFGKASCTAVLELENILGSRITDGVVIDVQKVACATVVSYQGAHPRPTMENVEATKHILAMADDTRETDLVLVVVSGGGSALLCGSESECVQGDRLYSEFVKAGGTIEELNVVRKHLSMVKGGGLAKLLYPATIVGLVFSDVPGDHLSDVASGPTFFDGTTSEDASRILAQYKLGPFELVETPKERNLFEKVYNISLVSNQDALRAMADEARAQGFDPMILTAEMYDEPIQAVERLCAALTPHSVVLAGGEVSPSVHTSSGSGGRCSYLALQALRSLGPTDVFCAFASDGIDNSPPAGALVDAGTLAKAQEMDIDVDDHLSRADSMTVFEKTGGLIITGVTGANVSDLMMVIRP